MNTGKTTTTTMRDKNNLRLHNGTPCTISRRLLRDQSSYSFLVAVYIYSSIENKGFIVIIFSYWNPAVKLTTASPSTNKIQIP